MTHRAGFERAAHVLAAVALACGLLAAAAFVESSAGGPAGATRPAARAPLTRGARGDVVARVTVPRLAFDAPVLEGVDSATLAQGPGHVPGTPLPGEDTAANHSVIVVPRDVGCTELARLRVGDRLQMRTPSGMKGYRVRELKIGSAEEVRRAAPRRAGVTLFTAYPPDAVGPAPMRLAILLDPVGPLVADERAAPVSKELAASRSARLKPAGFVSARQPARLATSALTRSTGRTMTSGNPDASAAFPDGR